MSRHIPALRPGRRPIDSGPPASSPAAHRPFPPASREIGIQFAQRPVLRLRDLLQNRQRRIALKRRLAGAHLVDDRAEAEQVGPGVARFADGLLGRHVQRRARDKTGARQLHIVGDAGQAEIGQLHAVVRRLQQNIARLDVAMDEPLRVGRRQALRDLHADAHDFLQRQLLLAHSRCSSVSPAMSCITR